MQNRWLQLLLCVICMMVISSPQYVWALFAPRFTNTLDVSLAQVQVAFSILIVMQTFLSPTQGYFIDRFGPRVLLSVGTFLTGLSWVCAAAATSLPLLYGSYGLLGGIGTGIVYIGAVGHMVRWFPDRRGFATGMVAAGYGFGAVLTTFPISRVIHATTYQHALLNFGAIFGIVGLVAAQGLRRPAAAWTTPHQAGQRTSRQPASSRSFTTREMLRTPIFRLMFFMMMMLSTSGLMVLSQIGAFTRDFGIADSLVFGLPLLPLALSIDQSANGLTRPFFGWVSDRIGRENTMVIAFSVESAATALLLLTRRNPAVFVIMSGLVFFGWGEIFSLFPSTLTDTFGTRHATTNYGCLYMAHGVGSVLGGPAAALFHEVAGSWTPVFAIIISMSAIAALLAQFALKPMRRRWLDSANRLDVQPQRLS
jgi:oxalate/formate antiporter